MIFLNKQTNICYFKYELRGFYDFTLRNIAIGWYHIYRNQMKEMFCLFLKWGISVQQKQYQTKKMLGPFQIQRPQINYKSCSVPRYHYSFFL